MPTKQCYFCIKPSRSNVSKPRSFHENMTTTKTASICNQFCLGDNWLWSLAPVQHIPRWATSWQFSPNSAGATFGNKLYSSSYRAQAGVGGAAFTKNRRCMSSCSTNQCRNILLIKRSATGTHQTSIQMATLQSFQNALPVYRVILQYYTQTHNSGKTVI